LSAGALWKAEFFERAFGNLRGIAKARFADLDNLPGDDLDYGIVSINQRELAQGGLVSEIELFYFVRLY
jgi:hypothetical protein